MCVYFFAFHEHTYFIKMKLEKSLEHIKETFFSLTGQALITKANKPETCSISSVSKHR